MKVSLLAQQRLTANVLDVQVASISIERMLPTFAGVCVSTPILTYSSAACSAVAGCDTTVKCTNNYDGECGACAVSHYLEKGRDNKPDKCNGMSSSLIHCSNSTQFALQSILATRT